MERRTTLVVLVISALLAAVLTAFYSVHEGLPRFLRAPTSLLLAPVAIVDGLCYAFGISGIYGVPLAVFLVNWVASAIVCGLVIAAKRWRRKASLLHQRRS